MRQAVGQPQLDVVPLGLAGHDLGDLAHGQAARGQVAHAHLGDGTPEQGGGDHDRKSPIPGMDEDDPARLADGHDDGVQLRQDQEPPAGGLEGYHAPVLDCTRVVSVAVRIVK